MPERLYILERGSKLGVFGDPIATAPVGNQTLAAVQREAARRVGLEIERVRSAAGLPVPCFIMEEDTYVTPRFLAAFAGRALALGANARAGLASTDVLERVAVGHPRADKVDGGFLFDLWYRATKDDHDDSHDDDLVSDDDGADGDNDLQAESVYASILIECDDLAYSRSRVPTALSEGGEIRLFESSCAILQIHDPVHLYQANMHQLVAAIRDMLIDGPPAADAADAGMRRSTRTARGNAVGEGVSIHPSAWVEGSILGDGVTIGAQAVVRHAVIDRGAQVFEQSMVQRSVLGQNALVHTQCRVLHSVLCAESFLSHSPFQFSFLGRGAAVFGTLPTDFRLDGRTVKTIIEGEVRDSGLEFLGLLVGHEAKVAAGVVSGPGRVIPNGAVVHRGPPRA
ncbi:MAG: hypothetical protein IPK13_20275 [Deltaproteobacteria bacterium]|nr:hypothetical protein [Deltaproteobacteria bacterium]